MGPLWSLCQSVKTSLTRRCDVGVDAALASRYQLRGQDLIVVWLSRMAMGVESPLGVPMARRFVVGIRQVCP
jgi:hypothetical protein